MRVCKSCKKKFEPQGNTLQPVCSVDCSIAYSKKLREKKEKEKGKQIRRKNKDTEENLRTNSQWLQILQKIFNKWIVLRDSHLPCVSCGTTNDVMYSCGHYYTVGSYPNLRFDPDNCHKQCLNFCNKNQHGNLAEYTPNLIKKIGQKRFTALEDRRHTVLRMNIPEIRDAIKKYKFLVKELNKR